MRARLLARPAALLVPMVVLAAGCSASDDTGTETQASIEAQAPTQYEVVSEEETDDGDDITVTVEMTPQEMGVQALVAELQETRTDDGVYRLTVLCVNDDAELATATWAQGDAALEETGLAEGDIDTDVNTDASCEV
ncbi:hypothetical protein WDZ17_02890 [Pseudokineococcus basanitobsidens]|uniref:Uncharacterized protein n=1 Tax=Pseudokineococcus basanitobsidens TaxID=1926649 RepID=A0ABU8RGY6_9ACTN